MRINSISHKLILTIVIPVITVLMAVGIFNYFDTKTILNQLIKTEQEFIRDEIRSFIELQFVALDIIEEPIQVQMNNYSNKFINDIYNENTDVKSIDLQEIRKTLGMDESNYDLYLINTDGMVINTTYADDLGINFFNFGEVHKRYLLRIFNEGIFDSPKFFFENTTKKYKKYSYQATKDKQYIFEIGLYSNQADRVFDYMINHLEKISEQRENLSSIDLFFWLDTPTSLNPEKEFIKDHINILPLLEKGEVVSKVNNSGNESYSYLYVENINSKLIKGAIVRLQHDQSYQSNFEKKEKIKFLIVLLIAFCLILFIAFFINPIGRVIKKITTVAKELAIGNLSITMDQKLKNRKDELGDLSNAIETLISGLVQTSEFASQTGKGNFNEKYSLLSEKDALGKRLLKMQERLTRAKNKEEQTLIEETKNKFISDGLAQLSEILRNNNNDITILCNNIMRYLVDYLELPMGALFIAKKQGNLVYFEAEATVAYDRLKLHNKKIKLGEGLVGRCAFEKLPIYIREIPDDYIHLTSGLGSANPKFLLLIPLISENEIYGVIELASFNAIGKHKIDFTEKLAISVASTLFTVQTNQQTIKLLEQSRIQSEELSAQEEEMRQNMEELQATQEESFKRESELQNMVNALDASVFKTRYSANGIIEEINDKYVVFLKQSTEALIGKPFSEELNILSVEPVLLDKLWLKLKQGLAQDIKLEIVVNDKKQHLQEYYWPINNEGRNSIIKISYLL